MEAKNKRSVIVGIFVFLALVIFAIGVMTLGGQQNIFDRGAVINAVFEEVNGLQAGNNVWFSGVKVGTVQAVTLNKDGRVTVSMNIDEKAQPFIKLDTRAKISADGFIGNKIVILYGGSATAASIQTGSAIPVEKSLGTDEIMATLQENNKNLLSITANFKTLSEGVLAGKGTIGKLLNDDRMVTELQQTIATIKSAAANAQTLSKDVSAYTARLTSKGSLANDLVTDTVLFSRLRSTVRQIDALSVTANQVVADLSTASGNLNRSMMDNSTSLGVLLNDKETAGSLKETIKNLQSSTYKLDENMEALQHNFLLRGFFRKRDKVKLKQD